MRPKQKGRNCRGHEHPNEKEYLGGQREAPKPMIAVAAFNPQRATPVAVSIEQYVFHNTNILLRNLENYKVDYPHNHSRQLCAKCVRFWP
jgi:hypothetical protein